MAPKGDLNFTSEHHSAGLFYLGVKSSPRMYYIPKLDRISFKWIVLSYHLTFYQSVMSYFFPCPRIVLEYPLIFPVLNLSVGHLFLWKSLRCIFSYNFSYNHSLSQPHHFLKGQVNWLLQLTTWIYPLSNASFPSRTDSSSLGNIWTYISFLRLL